MLRVRAWISGGAILSVAALVYLAGAGRAGDEDKAAQMQVLKIAAAIKANKDEGLKMAADWGKKTDTLEYIMHGFKPRKKDGIGVGKVAGAITPDGIELFINTLQRDGITPTALAKQAAAIEELAYISATVGEVTRNFTKYEFKGKKTKKDWQALAEKMRDGSLQLAAAVQAKGAAEVKKAAKTLNDACNACHSQFREP